MTSARKLADALKERARQVGQPQQSTSNGATDAPTSAGEQTTGPISFQKKSGSEIRRISLLLPANPV